MAGGLARVRPSYHAYRLQVCLLLWLFNAGLLKQLVELWPSTGHLTHTQQQQQHRNLNNACSVHPWAASPVVNSLRYLFDGVEHMLNPFCHLLMQH